MTVRSGAPLRSAGLRGFGLRLTTPIETAHGVIAERRGWLIRLEDSDGFVGLGEATPLSEFGTETRASCEKALRDALLGLIDPGARFGPSTADQVIVRNGRAAPCARAALDCAAADLAAQRQSVGLSTYWRAQAGLAGAASDRISVQALVSGKTPESVAEAAALAVRRGFRAFKLKLAVSAASRDLRSDLERLTALREVVGPGALLRLDANEAWSRQEALRALGLLADFDIDYVEQPVSRVDLDGLAFLDRESPTRVAADEALLGDGWVRCLEREAARILIVKPAAIGGIGVAIDLAARARARGLRIIWSSLLDGAVSRHSALHLAAAVGPEAEVHGLGTGSLIAADLADGEVITNGTIEWPASAESERFAALRGRAAFGDAGALWTGPAEFVAAER